MTTLLVPRHVFPARRARAFSLLSDFDRLFASTWPRTGMRRANRSLAPRIDVHESPEAWLIDAELPGLDHADIEVSMDEGVLTISAEHKGDESHEDEGAGYRHVERYHGSFRRSLRLPEGVDSEAISATYKSGVLHVNVPKPVETEPEVLDIPVTVA